MAEDNTQMNTVTGLEAKLRGLQSCPNCHQRDPACLVNRPCLHITYCVSCCNGNTKCKICLKDVTFQTSFDLFHQETQEQEDVALNV
nr:hypothetical protein BgiMline_021022 [Biomphalaria glabrata]